MKNKVRVLFLSHGGGPMPLLGDDSHREMIEHLSKISNSIEKPSAIIIVSAHWECDIINITSNDHPSLIYDYHGFPKEAYDIKYPCKGNQKLATSIYNAFELNGIKAVLNQSRGLDHGVFVPLKIMYPNADIPCVQLSLLSSLDPDAHIKMGEALKNLDFDNLLIIGSGFSFHNMNAFFSPASQQIKMMNESFEDWLVETCSSLELDEAERRNRLVSWEKAPFARFCHPREEHLLPLHVCYGITGRQCTKYFRQIVLNKQSSMYLW